MTTPDKDAVEALYKAFYGVDELLSKPPYTPNQVRAMNVYAERLAAQGFTLTRQTMTDAELKREAENLASDFQAGGYDESDWGAEIFDLAKKYRG